MFAIVVSEKGGAERRELFDKAEISVGRVQGNDLVLPKGNVSKRHARLLFRDGRVIVTDLKSTNGTYVNGRKIAQATIVRDGDKIYVGDFVLRVDTVASTAVAAPRPLAPNLSSVPTPGTTTAPTGAGPGSSSQGSASMPSAVPIGGPPRPTGAPSAAPVASPTPALVTAGSAGSGARPPLNFEGEFTVRQDGAGAATSAAPPDGPLGDGAGSPRVRLPSTPGTRPLGDGREPTRFGATPGPTLVPRGPSSHPASAPPDAMATARALALTALVERVAEAVDLTPLSRGSEADQVLAHRIERLIREKAKVLCDDGHLPATLELDDVIRDAQRDLLGLGPLDGLLDNEEVTEIRVFGHDHVTAVQGAQLIVVDPPFSSETALHRTIVRLCRQASVPIAAGETVVERYLPRGLLVHAVLPPTSQYGHALVVRKRRRAEVSLDDLVRSGTVSRAIATFLQSCVGWRTNLLLVGPADATSMLLSALTSAGQPSECIVALQTIDDLWGLEPGPVSLRLTDTGEEGAKLVRAAARLHPERLVVNPMAGHVAAAVMSVIAEGTEGVLATVSAPSTRHALDRLVPDLMAARPGLALSAAQAWLVGSFEIAIEIARLKDGRHRVMRVAELHPNDIRDIFTFAIERTAAGGAVEGSFVPSGVVPRIAEDWSARGGMVDSALFKRERG
jgi:pilus assembly protein CpaF